MPEPTERQYLKCTRCTEPIAYEGRITVAYPPCSYCGAKMRYMGKVDGNRWNRTEARSACDDRCTHAQGPDCDCQCHGVNHGSRRVVSIVVESGIARITTPNDPKVAERVARTLALADDFDRQIAEVEATLRDASIKLPAGKRNALRAELRHIRQLRTPKGRLDALAKVAAQISDLTPAEVVPEVSVEPEPPEPWAAPAPEPTVKPGKLMVARFPGTCTDCHGPVLKDQPIYWVREDRTVAHANCSNPSGIEGDAGHTVPVPAPEPVRPTLRQAEATAVVPAATSGFALTDEQEQFIDAALAGHNLLVQAGAGSGKTFTCDQAIRAIFARYPHKGITYTVFNSALKQEAERKLPKRCRVKTNHGLAYMPMLELMGRAWMDRLPQPVGLGRRQHGREVAKILNLYDFAVTVKDPATGKDKIRTLTSKYLAGYVRKALYNFCCSEESEPSERHVPPIKGLDRDAMAKVATFLKPYVCKAWADVISQDGRLTTTHDVYLKLWAEGGPSRDIPPYIRSEIIVADEAQDLTGVMFKVLAQQRHAQFVLVGDGAQELYGYRGAVNALDRYARERKDAVTLYLSTSFRFGPEIAKTANAVLGALKTPLRLTGAGFAEGRLQMVAKPDAILCRTNAGVMRAAMDMLMSRITADEAGLDLADYNEPYLLGGADEIVAFCQAALDLKQGRRTDHPELGCFSDWAEVESYVAEDPSADDLALFVKLVNDYGAQELLDAAERMPTKPGPGVTTLATIHRTKGLEWESVRLGDDFREYEKARDIPPAELRVIYVGLTRAKRYLEPYGCRPLMMLLEGNGALLADSDDEDLDDELFDLKGERTG